MRPRKKTSEFIKVVIPEPELIITDTEGVSVEDFDDLWDEAKRYEIQWKAEKEKKQRLLLKAEEDRERRERFSDNISSDYNEEEEIMNAIMRGDGDRFGY